MRLVIAAAEHGSFAAAAHALGMSPQMAGRYIGDLENALGVRLFERTTRRSRLTEVGQTYYARAQDAVAAVAMADDSVQAFRSCPTGTLRIAAPVAFGNLCLVPVIDRFCRLYPAVRVELELSDRVVDLIADGFDVAVRIGSLSDSSLIARALSPYDYVVCAAPAYLESQGSPTTPTDLAKHRCLVFSPAERPPDMWSLEGPDGACTACLNVAICINDMRALKDAAIAGSGIALIPRRLIDAELADHKLQTVLDDYHVPSRDMYLVYPNRQKLPKVSRFIEEAMRYFGAEQPAG
ncbi:transcriptional regulator [Salinisphaera sp. C84B14]|uniref:LysR family transcriptional regulator n=1 Tax=Salinisphaera sp. C84B14 TaxID=1304155 RepID=UPI0033400100